MRRPNSVVEGEVLPGGQTTEAQPNSLETTGGSFKRKPPVPSGGQVPSPLLSSTSASRELKKQQREFERAMKAKEEEFQEILKRKDEDFEEKDREKEEAFEIILQAVRNECEDKMQERERLF